MLWIGTIDVDVSDSTTQAALSCVIHKRVGRESEEVRRRTEQVCKNVQSNAMSFFSGSGLGQGHVENSKKITKTRVPIRVNTTRHTNLWRIR